MQVTRGLHDYMSTSMAYWLIKKKLKGRVNPTDSNCKFGGFPRLFSLNLDDNFLIWMITDN